jgi:Holliday junction resolvasome RuvABC endonuclease subunit
MVAVFEDATLRYYAVKVLRVPGTPDDVRRAAAHVLGSLIAAFQPTYMVIEQPLIVQQRAELLSHVIGALKTTAKRRGLTVSEYAPQPVRRFICGGSKPTKREVARRLAALYPELGRYVGPQSRWEELYYERMFGAIAVGAVAYALSDHKRADKKAGDKNLHNITP